MKKKLPKKNKMKKRQRKDPMEKLLERLKPCGHQLNIGPYKPFVVNVPGEKPPAKLPWPKFHFPK